MRCPCHRLFHVLSCYDCLLGYTISTISINNTCRMSSVSFTISFGKYITISSRWDEILVVGRVIGREDRRDGNDIIVAVKPRRANL